MKYKYVEKEMRDTGERGEQERIEVSERVGVV